MPLWALALMERTQATVSPMVPLALERVALFVPLMDVPTVASPTSVAVMKTPMIPP